MLLNHQLNSFISVLRLEKISYFWVNIMDSKLQVRRDEWLGLTNDEYVGIEKLYGTYLRTQIERYAEYKLAQVRQQELDIQKGK